MPSIYKKISKPKKKAPINVKNRQKLGLSQAVLGAILGHSAAFISMAEAGKRELPPRSRAFLTNIQQQFHELETGRLASYRSIETRLIMNTEYKKVLPEMKALEKECRLRVKELKKALEKMKEIARDKEHAIIIFTRLINQLQEEEKPDSKIERQISGLNLFKQQAYEMLLTCWEPEQAKLHARIEAIAGEAKALRRYRIKVVREHNPFKK